MSQECNKCRNAGFPNQMINFKINPNKAPAPGKAHYWDLLNGDESPHVHKTKQSDEQVQKKLESIGADVKEDTYKGATAQLSDISLRLDRIEKQNNTIIDYLAERAIGDE